MANAPGLGGSLAAEAATRVRAACRRLARRRQLDSELLQAGSDLGLLGRGRRRDRSVDVDSVAARLDLGDDLRHLPLLVDGLQGEARGDGGDALEPGDLLCLGLGEGELRPRQEEVVHEVRSRLAELGEVGDNGLIGLDDVAAAAERPAARVLLGRAGHRQVGADAGERVERGTLRLVEPLREPGDGDHETDADCEPEQREDRPAASAHQLGAEVPEVEHRQIEHARLRTG